jgi:hypothetical protein
MLYFYEAMSGICCGVESGITPEMMGYGFEQFSGFFESL